MTVIMMEGTGETADTKTDTSRIPFSLQLLKGLLSVLAEDDFAQASGKMLS